MSKYIRDDKTFRAQISNLADAGLKFPTAPAKLPEYLLHFDEMESKLVGEPGSITIGFGQVCSLHRARPCSECVIDMSKLYGDTKATLEAHGFSKKDYPANFNGVPAYVRTIEPNTTRGMSEATDYTPLEIAPKGKLPEFVAGAIAATIVLLLVAGAAYLGWRIL